MKTVYHEADPDTMYHLEDLSRFLLFMLTLIIFQKYIKIMRVMR
jgi:hypothetical protein